VPNLTGRSVLLWATSQIRSKSIGLPLVILPVASGHIQAVVKISFSRVPRGYSYSCSDGGRNSSGDRPPIRSSG
jgi:hypothetical protein